MQFPEHVKELIPKWRRMGYEPHCVSVPFGKSVYPVVFRTLTKKEFDELFSMPLKPREHADKYLGDLWTEQYEEILRIAVLWPYNLDPELPAASDKIIADAIVNASGWTSTQALEVGLGQAREKAMSLEGFLKSRVLAAYPNYRPEELDNLRFNELMNLVAGSEIITGVKVDIRPWTDPEAYQKDLDRQQRMQKRIMQERAHGMNVDPKMKDPEFRRRLIEQAQASRENLRNKPDKIDLDKMNEGLERIKNA